jgi:hypothetical protein
MLEFSPVTAVKKQAVKFVPPQTGYAEFARFRTRLVRISLRLLGALGAIAFFGGFYWFFHLAWTSPGASTAATGQIVELSNHGKQFYVRSGDAVLFNAMSIGGFCAVAIAIGASMAIFGTETGQRTLTDRIMSVVWTVFIVLGIAVVATGGYFPFAMVQR